MNFESNLSTWHTSHRLSCIVINVKLLEHNSIGFRIQLWQVWPRPFDLTLLVLRSIAQHHFCIHVVCIHHSQIRLKLTLEFFFIIVGSKTRKQFELFTKIFFGGNFIKSFAKTRFLLEFLARTLSATPISKLTLVCFRIHLSLVNNCVKQINLTLAENFNTIKRLRHQKLARNKSYERDSAGVQHINVCNI